jgi:hypothetical protein
VAVTHQVVFLVTNTIFPSLASTVETPKAGTLVPITTAATQEAMDANRTLT